MKKYEKFLTVGLFSLFSCTMGKTQTGAALNFDGINDYANIPHTPILKPSSAITIEAWINSSNISLNTDYVIYQKEDGDARHLFSFQNNGTILSFGLGVDGNYSELDVAILQSDYEDQWVHIAATYDGSAKKIYRNGILIGTQNISGPIGTDGYAFAMIGSTNGISNFFKGSIDEFRLWNRALSQCEIQSNLNCELNLPRGGLIVYYPFNQGIAGGPNTGLDTLADSAKNLNATLKNFSLSGTSSNWVASGGVMSGIACITPNIYISADTNVVCVGSTVNFSATAINSNAGPTYQWKKNGMDIAGQTGINYTSSTLSDGDTITCVLSTDVSCNQSILSNNIRITVKSLVAPFVIISSDAITSVCTGDSVGFAAKAIHGGSNPAYQWTKNGSDILSATGPIYYSSSLSDNDTIRCKIISNSGCISTANAVSEGEVVSVSPIYTFTGNGDWNLPSNWVNNRAAPHRIPPCAQVIIDPAENEECILNHSLQLENGAILTVVTGKKFTITGGSVIDSITTGDLIFGTGEIPETLAQLENIPLADTIELGTLVEGSRIMLAPSHSIDMPPAGDQGTTNSCVGWAVGYGLLGHWNNKLERNKKPNGSFIYEDFDKLTSSYFLWTQLNAGMNKGISLVSALEFFKTKGCCKLADMPSAIPPPPPNILPSAQASHNAKNYQNIEFSYSHFWKIDLNKIKESLVSNLPMPFSGRPPKGTGYIIKIHPDGRAVFTDGPSGLYLGDTSDRNWHAMVLCGYDDAIHAFKVLNSWGTTWGGNGGYFWIDYEYFKKWVRHYSPGSDYRLFLPSLKRADVALSTSAITDINVASAKSSCIIESNADQSIIYERGFCYSEKIRPTTAWGLNDSTVVCTSDAPAIMTGLKPATKYYVRSYAKTNRGIVYGNQVDFTTAYPLSNDPDSTFTDPRDGRVYTFRHIGTQVWMTTNLRYDTLGSVCYQYFPNFCASYGRLYHWYTAIRSAPPGWHLPSKDEWQTLINFLGGETVAGGAMKSTSSLWDNPNTGATNISRFSGLPGGYGGYSGSFGTEGTSGYWWSSTEYNSPNAFYNYLFSHYAGTSLGNWSKSFYLSVRCVRD